MIDETQMEDREIADLLPWYANGRLAGRERHRVAIALASDPALQRELALILEEQTASIDANEALGAPSRAAADRFFAALDAEVPTRKPRLDAVGWLVTRVPNLQPRLLAWSAIAVAVLVVVQAGVISTLLSQRPTTYAVSSIDPGGAAQSGASLLVAFEPTASIAAIAAMLENNGASIVAGPLPGGLYRLRFGDHHPMAKANVDAMVARLKAQKALIHFIAPQSPSD